MSSLLRSSQTTFRSFDKKLGTYILKKIYKISTVVSRQVQIDQAQHQIRNNKWDPSTQSLPDFTATFSDLKSILSNMPIKPSPATYRRWWITLFPVQFKQVQYLLIMNDLPPHWSNVNEITDLAEATQIEIDTRLLKLATSKPKDTDRNPRNTRNVLPGPTPPTQPTPIIPNSDHPPCADGSHRYSWPPTYTGGKDFCHHIRKEMEAGKTQESLKLRYATPADQGCWLCRFKKTDPAFHQDTTCNLLKIFYPYSSEFSLDNTFRACKTTLPPAHTVISTPLMMCYDSTPVLPYNSLHHSRWTHDQFEITCTEKDVRGLNFGMR